MHLRKLGNRATAELESGDTQQRGASGLNFAGAGFSLPTALLLLGSISSGNLAEQGPHAPAEEYLIAPQDRAAHGSPVVGPQLSLADCRQHLEDDAQDHFRASARNPRCGTSLRASF